MTLRLASRHLLALRRRSEEAYPEECCGFLLGRPHKGVKEVAAVRPSANAAESGPDRRYRIPAEAYFDAQRDAGQRGLAVVGFYHSHPDAPAEPSEEDRAGALPGVSMVIISVENGRAGAARSWLLAGDRSRFDPEPLDG